MTSNCLFFHPECFSIPHSIQFSIFVGCNRNINPRDNWWLKHIGGGEGWHNYHHTFPWDYRSGELGGGRSNLIAYVIDWFHAMGWAYDLKSVPTTMIRERARRTGDGSWDGIQADDDESCRSD